MCKIYLRFGNRAGSHYVRTPGMVLITFLKRIFRLPSMCLMPFLGVADILAQCYQVLQYFVARDRGRLNFGAVIIQYQYPWRQADGIGCKG